MKLSEGFSKPIYAVSMMSFYILSIINAHISFK
ncbi:hypothetical protein [Clostridium estertheticum]|nr:hypothetical protein [Clostridium estertheticum]